ncbi:carnosine synthase 1-like [Megalops cyprinoides]|uniref:carnosine synthase 1-like n=1 Tax=Megalops cyprinoides TaxID=118141 RepID=UPI0018649FA3|nr:carnosine synthase 1-like [Megalops cyprinoides]
MSLPECHSVSAVTMLSLNSQPSSLVSSFPPWRQENGNEEADSHHLERALYQTLQEVLREIGLPKTREHDETAPGESHSEVCICVLGSPLPYLSLLLEAGQISPGNSLLCLSPSWLSRSSSSLVVHRAVSFDLGGRTTLLNFSPPRRVTYLLTCDPWVGEEVTQGADCPMGVSLELGQFWGDTLTARVMLQKAKINCPPTLALLMPPGQKGVAEGRTGVIEVVQLEAGAQRWTESIRNKLNTFLASEALRDTDRVVLRHSGGRFVSGSGGSVLYLPRDNKEEVWVRVKHMLSQLFAGESVLVEAYCPPLKPGPRVEDRTWEQYSECRPHAPDLTFRLCAIVTRSPQNVPLLYKMVCKVGACSAPLSHSHSLSQSLETTLSDCGFADPSIVTSLKRLATDTALACFQVVIETESGMSPEQRGGVGAQSDLIGVDLLFTLSGWTITPVVLGLHPSRCLETSFLGGGVAGWGRQLRGVDEDRECCLGSLLHSPLTRSQCYLMEGKTVLVIGAGGFSKKFVWEAARQYRLKILLVDSDPSHFASQLVDHFFPLPDLPDHRRDDQHCARICDWVRTAQLHPDGCVCFWDDCVVLASLVCRELGLRGPPPESIHIAKEKSRTHLHLLGHSQSRPTAAKAGVLSGDSNSDPFANQHTAVLKNPDLAGDLKAEERERPVGITIETLQVNMDLTEIEGESLRAMMDFDKREQMGLKGEDHHRGEVGNLDPPPRCPINPSLSPSPFCLSTPHLSPSPSAYAVPCVHIESSLDLKNAVRDEAGKAGVRFPAVLKLEYGAGAVGVKKIGSLEEGLVHLEKIAGDLREETDYPGIGLGWGNAMTLMEFVGGTEHDVDLLLFDGQLEGAFVSDNGPTRVPSFTETAAQMPSGLAPDKREQLIRAAYHSCLGCGLRDGVFNVELKMTELGPRLIEINARMGGFYLRDWIRQLYGVDILLAAFMVACGLPPRLPTPTALPAQGHFVGVMCVVSQHLQALKTTARLERLRQLHQEGALRLNELEDELISGEYEEPYCNVGVRAAQPADARRRLLALCQGLGLHCPPRYDLRYFLSHFK